MDTTIRQSAGERGHCYQRCFSGISCPTRLGPTNSVVHSCRFRESQLSSNDQEIQLWLLIQSIACQYAWPGLTVNATGRLTIVDGKPENFILLYILLLWSYNKIICLLLWSCWGSWLRWLWYHGVAIGCAIMHSIHRWTDWLQNQWKKRFIEHTNTTDIRCTSNVWGQNNSSLCIGWQINLDAWWGFDSTSHRLKYNVAKCNNNNNNYLLTVFLHGSFTSVVLTKKMLLKNY